MLLQHVSADTRSPRQGEHRRVILVKNV